MEIGQKPGVLAADRSGELMPPVPLRRAAFVWARVAALSFGGPAGQIAVMHRIIVEEQRWMREERFLHALNYCMFLPGPEATQLATYIGWVMHGTRGGILAGVLFILPGVVSILLLSLLYVQFQNLPAVDGLLFGLKSAVLSVVLEAVLRIGRRVLKNGAMVTVAAAAFGALFLFQIPFPVVVLAAGVVGAAGGRLRPEWFSVLGRPTVAALDVPADETLVPTGWKRSLRVSVACLTLWWAPLALIRATLGAGSVYWQIGLFFSQAALVTFGGAYAVLAHVAQEAVHRFGWLRPGEMLDGLGMAETTPGPLIMVVQFVGFLGAYREPGPLTPLAGGLLGALVTTWVTFVPCFYWIFLGAPYVERLRGQSLLGPALSSITAAVVGVVLNLGVWMALQTLFERVGSLGPAPLAMPWPDWRTVNAGALAIALLAGWMTFGGKRGMAVILAVSAAAGCALQVLLAGRAIGK
jgi:chromate transporter